MSADLRRYKITVQKRRASLKIKQDDAGKERAHLKRYKITVRKRRASLTI